MKIEKHYSLQIAEAILSGVQQYLDNFEVVSAIDGITQQCYQNGREQGIALFFIRKETYESVWIAFAEYRNSDEIVVYVDDHDPRQGVSDSAYDHRKNFLNPDEAIAFIVNTIGIKSVIKS